MNLNRLADKYMQARLRQGLQHPEARRVASTRTTRDMHPATGSTSILQAATAGTTARQVSSLNTDSGERAFCFDITGFGWDQADVS